MARRAAPADAGLGIKIYPCAGRAAGHNVAVTKDRASQGMSGELLIKSELDNQTAKSTAFDPHP
jgi:hypothetical protein